MLTGKLPTKGKLIPPAYLQTLLRRAFDRNNPYRYEEQHWLSLLAGQRGRWLLPQMGFPVWGESGNGNLGNRLSRRTETNVD